MRDQHLYKSPSVEVYWSLQITINLTESALLIFFCNLGLKNCWHGLLGIEPTTLDLGSQSGAYNLSPMVNMPNKSFR